MALLRPAAGGAYLDGTVGGGGHAAAILRVAGGRARLFGIDRDPARVAQAAAALEPFGDAVRLVVGAFSDVDRLLPAGLKGAFQGAVVDLGVSSDQLDDPARGFGFREEGPLDMRLDPRAGPTAADLLAERSERELADLIYAYGEEPRSRRIARAIVSERRRHPIRTTAHLAAVVARAVGGRRGRRHPATRTFQALRIAVNDELDEIARGLPALFAWLAPGGRLVAISFHSLEDRLVKRFFRKWARAGKAEILTPKPLRPDRAEVRDNPRARSAKLRAVERR